MTLRRGVVRRMACNCNSRQARKPTCGLRPLIRSRWSSGSCLPFDPKFAVSNPAEDNGFLRAIQIRNTSSFREKVKPSILFC
jgi:hypothetical protein